MRLPASGGYRRWTSQDARFVRGPLEDLADEGVRIVVLMCSAQSAKTETAIAGLEWVLCEAPGATLWLTRDIDEAKVVAKDRLNPAFDLCEPLHPRLPKGRIKRTTLAIYILGSILRVAGAKSIGALQSTPYRYLFLDEARSYPKGALGMVDKRTRSYTHNYKKVIFSTPMIEGDEFDSAYEGGNQQKAFVACPKCGHRQTLEFAMRHDDPAGVLWVENELTRREDDFEYEALLETVFWRCANSACKHELRGADIDANSPQRKAFSREIEWRAQNPKAPTWYRSYHWNALLPFWSDWRKLVHEYLEARKSAKWGNWEPLKNFYQESLGQPWSDRLMTSEDEQAITQRQHDYKPMDIAPPPEAWRGSKIDERRFMTVDVQSRGGRHFYVVIRHWWRGGASKLIHAGKAYAYEELDQLAITHHVDQLSVIIDSGHAASEVYREILKRGKTWKAFKDEDRYSFPVAGVHRIVQRTSADPAIGTMMAGRVPRLDVWLVAKYGCLDRFTMLLQGVVGDWQFYEAVPDDYISQITAYQKLPEKDKRGHVKWKWACKYEANHYCSCELYQVAAAAMTGMIFEAEGQTDHPESA